MFIERDPHLKLAQFGRAEFNFTRYCSRQIRPSELRSGSFWLEL
jgi:hypothetical protein